MSTPEGLTKNKIKKLLAEYKICPAKDAGDVQPGAQGWYFCPSQNGFGVTGIPDFLGHYKGQFWAIEAKAPRKTPTGFQELQIKAIRLSGARCFVVSGEGTLSFFEDWLKGV